MSSGISDECILSAFEQSRFDPNDNIIFCQIFEAGDYHQIFIIALIIFLICLGMGLLPFSVYGILARMIHETRIISRMNIQSGIQEFQIKIEILNERNLARDRYVGIPFKLYFLFRILLCCIYLSIKFILLTNSSNNNRYKDINNRFNDNSFKQFVNAENIILLIIIIHNLLNIREFTKIYYKKRNSFNSFSTKCIGLLCIIILWIDAFSSWIIIFIKWSLFVLFLYNIAVIMLISCFAMPIYFFFVAISLGKFVQIVNDNNNCKGIIPFGAALIVTIWSYLCGAVYLYFIFLFVGGPSYCIIYVNFDDTNQFIVICLFVIATFIALLAALIGYIYDYKDSNDPETQILSIPNQSGYEYV